MMPNRWESAAALGALLLATGLAGCRMHVDKNEEGKEKKVQIDTPFGGVHVNTDQTTAADLGLPTYPGAIAVKDNDNSSADVHLGFGPWQLRVRVAKYESPDAKQKVSDFYKQALGRYGEVLTCQNEKPIGQPTMTSQGLSCASDGKSGHININDKNGKSSLDFGKGIQLKAGSKRHQHVVGFEDPQNGRTRFTLIALDLPSDNSDKKD
jgi:hypothetical protein